MRVLLIKAYILYNIQYIPLSSLIWPSMILAAYDGRYIHILEQNPWGPFYVPGLPGLELSIRLSGTLRKEKRKTCTMVAEFLLKIHISLNTPLQLLFLLLDGNLIPDSHFQKIELTF